MKAGVKMKLRGLFSWHSDLFFSAGTKWTLQSSIFPSRCSVIAGWRLAAATSSPGQMLAELAMSVGEMANEHWGLLRTPYLQMYV
jgi:ABC-type amino acid transport system permease subunit